MKVPLRCAMLALTLLVSVSTLAIENLAPGGNSEPAYVQLRHIQPAGDAYEVKNLKIVRDIGILELRSGTLCLLAPVQGMITGAVFRGDGTFSLRSDDPREQNQMKLLTKSEGISEEFEKLVLRFSDTTPDELKNALTVKPSGSCSGDLVDENQKFLRTDLRYNLAGRLLQPVLAGQPDGFFLAFIQGKKYGRLGFMVDPRGADLGDAAPEEVVLADFKDSQAGVWYSGHLLSESHNSWQTKHPNHQTGFLHPEKQKINTTIEKSGLLSATTTGTFVSAVDNLRVIPFDLFHKLRVTKVTDENGNALAWIQEKQDEDYQYFVVLAKPANRGDRVVVASTYSGKEAVVRSGDGNYYPVARHNWFPNPGHSSMYQFTFSIPKNLTMAATGTLVSQRTEGSQNISEWTSDVPLPEAGFNFGDFKSETVKLEKQGVQVTAYVNKEIPDMFKQILAPVPEFGALASGSRFTAGGALGNLSTTPMLKRSLAEAELSVQLYSDYFGPMSYKSLQITQQTAGNYGQAWPGLVFMPIFYYLDTTQRHQFGLDDTRSQYWKVVEPHEVAHQWWGHTVTWTGYRDQWMSEGFADFSASLFIQYVRNDRKEYLQFWKNMRDRLVEKDQFGHRPIDVASVTMGYRAATAKVGGFTAENLIYPKGAYILHMIRQMMFSKQTGDADFKAMMKDLVNTYRDKSMSTEDFKHMVEKHITTSMNVNGDGKMDWFFDEWVYGTEIPHYSMDTTNETGPDGKPTIAMRITQSGVSPKFKMIVPVYFELSDGKVGKLGSAFMEGNQTITQKVPFGSTVPKRLIINYNYDVLSTD
jgi:hypothetical protein